MKSNRWMSLFVVSATSAAFAACALAAAIPTAFANRPWTKTVGTSLWYIDLNTVKHSFALRRAGPTPMKPLVRGTLTVSGSTMTFTDHAGPLACRGASATGRYRYVLHAKALKLRLATLHDACKGRHSILAGTLDIAPEG